MDQNIKGISQSVTVPEINGDASYSKEIVHQEAIGTFACHVLIISLVSAALYLNITMKRKHD